MTVSVCGLTLPAMQLTIELPDELAERLESKRDRLAEIIERGLRQISAESSALAQEVVAFLARGPQPEAIVAFHPSATSVACARALLEKNASGALTPAEQAELDEMADLNQFFALIKAQARQHLRGGS